MQDFTPADGKEVFILTDSVSLLGSKGKHKTVDNPYIHKQLWPLLSAHFKELTMISMSGCQTKDILREVDKLVQAKARGNPAAFDHVLIIMPTLNELYKRRAQRSSSETHCTKEYSGSLWKP